MIMQKYLQGWEKTQRWNIPNNFNPNTFVSVIIPARNEEENITACLNSIVDQSYPTDFYEIIVVDDHSSDNTAQLIRNHPGKNIHLISLAEKLSPENSTDNSFKKMALEQAILHSKGSLILSTDADCIVQKDWIKLIASYFKYHDIQFLAAPVNFHKEESLFEKFQSLDFAGMMGITAAGIAGRFMHMCNGANLAYRKEAFGAVEGFKGIDHLASGDDMLLMQKIAQKYPGKIGFLKNKKATVYTKAKATLNSFLNQRVRWASKSKVYPEQKVTLILAMIFFFCWTIIANAFLASIIGLPFLYILLIQILVKGIFDHRLLNSTTRFFNRTDLLTTFASSFLMHIIYVAGIGLLANLKSTYQWKGRQVK